MANKNILTTSAKITQIELVYNSPQAVVPPFDGVTLMAVPLGTTYCFLSKVLPWDDDNNPSQPQADVKYIKQVQKSMFVAKKITASDISPVIERIDWVSGTVYEHYQDDIDMIELDVNGFLIHHFYVRNKYDQVFKCLWNNNDLPSTVEPYFEPGTYGNNNIFTGTDGYKWKYIYTIDTGLKIKFMDNDWMPITVGANTPNPLVTTAGAGSLDVINLTNGGSGYDPANSIITIKITGDGTGARANVANVDNGVITDINVENPGTNYTYANVTIVSASGSNAAAFAPTSPVGGHGFDPISEFGCSHIMFTSEFTGSEDGVIPTDIDYHQIGIVINPTTRGRKLEADNNSIPFALPANNNIYSTSTDFLVAAGFGTYVQDERIFQGRNDNIDDATFTATVLSFNTSSNVLRLINTTGTPIANAPVRNTTKTNRTLLSYSTPDYSALSGYVVFVENRSGIQRSPDGIEQVRLVLGY